MAMPLYPRNGDNQEQERNHITVNPSDGEPANQLHSPNIGPCDFYIPFTALGKPIKMKKV
jgi:hypothetical protein